MVLALNLAGNGYLTPPGGYPFVLWAGGQTFANGAIPKGASSITATVIANGGVTPTGSGSAPANANKGAPNAYLALFAMPTSSGGADGAEVAGTRVTVIGMSALQSSTLTCTVPSTSSAAPACYIARLWVDGLSGTNGVKISSIMVS
jgi:hypothetical protein